MQSHDRQCTQYISAEHQQATVPAVAEVPVCGLAIAQSANLFRHRSTFNRSLQAAPVLSFYPLSGSDGQSPERRHGIPGLFIIENKAPAHSVPRQW